MRATIRQRPAAQALPYGVRDSSRRQRVTPQPRKGVHLRARHRRPGLSGGEYGEMSSSTQSVLDALLASLAGAVLYDLEQPRHPDMPVHPAHKPGYFYLLHRRHADTYDPEHGGPRSSASGLIVTIDH